MAAAAGLCAWVAVQAQQATAFRSQFVRGRAALDSLQYRCPTHVSLDEWELAFVWVTRVYVEAFFSPFDTDPQVVQKFADAIEKKLTQEVSIEIFDWVWNELEKATPAGQRYAERFRPMFWEPLEDLRKRRKLAGQISD